MKRVTDLEKFALEQIWRPYGRDIGLTERPDMLPKSLEDTAIALRENKEWARLVFSRLYDIGVSFPKYVCHPLVDVVIDGVHSVKTEREARSAAMQELADLDRDLL